MSIHRSAHLLEALFDVVNVANKHKEQVPHKKILYLRIIVLAYSIQWSLLSQLLLEYVFE